METDGYMHACMYICTYLYVCVRLCAYTDTYIYSVHTLIHIDLGS